MEAKWKVTLWKSPTHVGKLAGVTLILISGEGESKHSLFPVVSHLTFGLTKTRGHPRSTPWGLRLEQVCMVPSFSSMDSISRVKMYPVIMAWNVFEETLWKKYYIHKENSKTNSTLANGNLFAAEHNKGHSTQNGCALWAGVGSHNYGQRAITIRMECL